MVLSSKTYLELFRISGHATFHTGTYNFTRTCVKDYPTVRTLRILLIFTGSPWAPNDVLKDPS